jgi:hypothetical protein
LGSRQPLALRAVPVAATVVSDADQAAAIALLDMPAKRCGPAGRDGRHDAMLIGQQPTTLGSTECIAVAAENVRHLQRGTHRYVGVMISMAS